MRVPTVLHRLGLVLGIVLLVVVAMIVAVAVVAMKAEWMSRFM